MSDPAPAPAPSRPSPVEEALLGVRVGEAHRLVPGVLLGIGVVWAAGILAGALGARITEWQGLKGGKSPIPVITVAVLLGILLANTVGTPRAFRPGLSFCVKKLLRLGIILVGVKLSLAEVLKGGGLAIPVVAAVIAFALLFTAWLAPRLGVSDRLGTLAAASTAICGVTATVAVAPTIDADDREVAYTVANVTLYGLLGMFLYPYVAHALFAARPGAAGLFLGTAIHDTSQVTGAALSYQSLFSDEAASKAAILTKLTRNVFLVGVVPLLAALHARKGGGGGKRASLAKLFPLFVLGFLAMAILRTVGDARAWNLPVAGIEHLGSEWCLPAAMAGVGLTTDLRSFRGLGLRPLWLGAASALAVGALALGLAALLGGA